MIRRETPKVPLEQTSEEASRPKMILFNRTGDIDSARASD